MFDTWKNLNLLHEKLDKKNMLFSGRRLFKTDIDNILHIDIIVGYNNTIRSQKHIHENKFYIKDYENQKCTEYKFVDFVKYLQQLELFDEFKFRLEEKLLIDV
ncbi:MAG: hypothetical protein H8D97_00870 [Proteobacteria bacterium]|nr:hypothetical protein [Pseudomonadota bacterium]